ncbi:hypothetical protein BH23ACT10_BH23ACT10_06800 [soil metagenome]
MPVFPSSEWIDAFCVELAGHPRAPAAAATLGGVYRFVIDPGGPLGDRHTYAVLLGVDGDAAVAAPVAADEPSRVTVRTDYRRWRQLLEGKLDLGPAMLLGRLRISGDMAALLNARGDVDVVVDALRGVDTMWLDAAV